MKVDAPSLVLLVDKWIQVWLFFSTRGFFSFAFGRLPITGYCDWGPIHPRFLWITGSCVRYDCSC